MKVPLVATLICLCGAASAAACDTATRSAPPSATRHADGLVLAALTWPDRPAHRATAAPATTDEPRQDEHSLWLAGVALMAAIALRRTGGTR